MKKNTLIILFVCAIIISIVLAPLVVNELYKQNDGYLTLWGAKDMLAYISSVISAVATLFVSWVAITQNKIANEINDRLLKIEEQNAVPSLSVIENKCIFVEYSETTIHFKIFVKNISNGIIDIKKVSDMNFHIVQSDISDTLSFLEKGLEYPTLLPGQEKQLDFSVYYHTKEPTQLCNREFIVKSKCQLVLSVIFTLILGYKDSKNLYKETIKISDLGKFVVSSNVSIIEQKVTRSDYKLESMNA